MPKMACSGCGVELKEEWPEGKMITVFCWICWQKEKQAEADRFLQREKERQEAKRG